MTVGRLLVVAPLGPVVTGRSVVSVFMVQSFRDAGMAVVEVNISPRSRKAWVRLLRPAAFGTAIARLLTDRGRSIRVVYLAVDGGLGMCLTIATVAAARLVGADVVLHHHTYGYLRRRTLRAACLMRMAGRDAPSIVQCPSMKDKLCRRYGLPEDLGFVLSNAVTVAPPPTPSRGADDGKAGTAVSIGYLSVVSFEKGVDDAIDTTMAVAERRPGSRIVVAGPCDDGRARSYLLGAQRRHPGQVEYRGPLDELGKAAFFDSIDVFVFPSKYNHETQGIVNLEALAHGVPIIARGMGCIVEDFARAPAMVVRQDEDFVAVAADAIVGLASDGGLRALRQGARRQFEILRSQAEEEHRRVVTMVGQLTRGGGVA